MKKRAKTKGVLRGRKRLDTVGVAGSIPVEPTIRQLKQTSQTIEIPDNYDVVPAVRWQGGYPEFYRVLIKK